MLPPVAMKNTTRIAGWLFRRAQRLAMQARDRNLPTKQDIREGFLLRGLRLAGKRYQAQILDLPQFLLLGGTNGLSAALAVYLPGIPVGTRDDLVIPDNDEVHHAFSEPGAYLSYLLQPSSAPPDLGASPSSYAPQSGMSYYDKALFGYGYMQAGLKIPANNLSFYALDDMNYFTFAEDCTFGVGMTAPYAAAVALTFSDAGVPTVGGVPTTYLNGSSMWLLESELDAGWLLHPRRQVQYTAYATVGDPYRSRRIPGVLNTGFMFTQAPTLQLVGVDEYCAAARGFKQYIGTWYEAPPEASYRPLYYDRDGEQALIVARGQYDRSTYDPATSPQARATVDSVQYLLATDLTYPLLHPYPPTIPGNAWGKPVLPGVGKFLTPYVGRTTEGYVVFTVYTTYRDESLDPGASPDWQGDAYGLVTVLPNGDNVVLKADWDSGGTAALFPDASAAELVVPTIIGCCTLPDATVLCFVWEHSYNRKGTGDSNARGLGGNIVIYKAEANTVTRTVLTSDYAPLFASILQRRVLPFDAQTFAVELDNPLANVAWVGGSKVALAVVDGPPAIPTSNSATTVSEHGVYALVYDAETETFAVTDQIFTRTSIRRKALLSAPRLDGERPAVMLAAVTEATPTNNGAGKIYIRHTDGDNNTAWREYVTDIGGQGGAFFAGNKAWWYDQTLPLTTGGEQ